MARRLSAAQIRRLSDLRKKAAAKGDLEGLKKGLGYLSATLASLAGTDDGESPLIVQMKKDLGEPVGETIQDFLLLFSTLTDALLEDLGDGKITGPEATASLFALMGEMGEIVSDIEAASNG